MTKTPNFSAYLRLERLILKKCYSLIEVDSSLEKLKCLIHFNANGCSNLMELPEGVGQLEKLKYLYLGNCEKLRKLPKSFVRVASLVELDLSNTAITRLPNSIGNQKCLSILNLRSTKIDELPNSIGSLRELKFLVLSNTNIRKLPMSIGNLESLLELDVSGTRLLQLPESIGDLSRLKVINISYSLIMELPPSIVELKALEELHAKHCLNLKWEIPEDIWKLSLLRILHLEFTPIRNVPMTIKLLPRLEKLGLCHCSGLKLLPELPTSLISLNFGSRSLRYVPDILNLTKLVDLSYGGHDENCCPLFSQDGPCQHSLAFLPPSVSTLSLRYHESIHSLSFRCNLRNLTRLYIYQCRWKEVQLDGLDQLIEFEMEGLKLLEGFAGLSNLKRLKLLRLTSCPNLTAIQGLGLVESLEKLEIDRCGFERLIGLEVESLQLHKGFAGLSSLRRLSLFNCPNLTAIQGLGSVESLEELEIQWCPKIESLDDLSDLKKLESLVIRGCEELLAVEGLDELDTLKYLQFISCGSLRSFPNVLNWKVPDECSLTILGCPNLEDNDVLQGTVKVYKQRKVREERGEKKMSWLFPQAQAFKKKSFSK
ncbi:hypothetical protein BT93_L4225 [Corymbia citriodora subsp. variegata]|uniref:Uncharacterized protein n=1 Tax=Corymbia citriodora subsp. variegata TaxID=360336 RepID=A0A8T0CL41_CORYI|nr:hypothetical protein BT93_L4225 [Corymbia citriodora subsp. variegata]